MKNNKGFAISTVIYGLSIMGILLVAIMMSTMSSSRANTSGMAKSIEDELNRVSRTEVSFAYKLVGDDDAANIPEAQTYIVPEGQTGFYRIELWGSQGGSETEAGGGAGGLGAYTSGLIFLKEGQTLYFYVGRHQLTGSGRATEVRVTGGGYADQSSYVSTIMAAAGGGTTGTAYGGTLFGYNNRMFPYGGSVDTYSTTPSYGIVADGNKTNGTLIGLPGGDNTMNYTKSAVVSSNVSSSMSPVGAVSDGYVPSSTPGVGGTSYISGYGGVQSYKTDGTKDGILRSCVSYVPQTTSYNEETGETTYVGSTPVYFLDGRMYPGVNTGDGKAKIERISIKGSLASKEDLKRNDAFKLVGDSKDYGIKEIKDCVDASIVGSATGQIKGVRVAAISSGVDFGKYSTNYNESKTINGKSLKCATVVLSTSEKGVNLDEIDIWHVTKSPSNSDIMPPPDMRDGVDILNHTVEVLRKGTWVYVKNLIATTYTLNGATVGSNVSETETVEGIRISAYQSNGANTSAKIKDGDYYIMPVTTYGKVLTAPPTMEEISNDIVAEPIMGYKRQRWSIERITNDKILSSPTEVIYKITEQARYKSLTVDKNENMEKNFIKANRSFSTYQRDDAQIWKITPAGDGTYFLSIARANPLSGLNYSTGNLIVQSNSTQVNDRNKLFIGRNNPTTERYRLISIDYLE